MNEKKWFLMEHEEYGTRAAYVILSEDGAVVMNDCTMALMKKQDGTFRTLCSNRQ